MLETERSNLFLSLKFTFKEKGRDKFLVSTSNWDSSDLSTNTESSIYEVFGYDTYDFWVIGETLTSSIHEFEVESAVVLNLPSEIESTFSRAKEGRMFVAGLTDLDGSIAYVIPTSSSQESRSTYSLLRDLARKHNLACLVRFLPTEQLLVPILDPAAYGSVSYRILKVVGDQNLSAKPSQPKSTFPTSDESPF